MHCTRTLSAMRLHATSTHFIPTHTLRRSINRCFSTAAASTTASSAPSAPASVPRTLLLIDAAGLVFRHYFGYKRRWAPITAFVADSEGNKVRRDVGALYGYASSLLHLCAHLRPTHVAACMDTGSKSSFRAKLFPEYKIDRPPVEEDLRWQLTQLASVSQSLGIEPLAAEGFEADDIIGTLAHLACSTNATAASSTLASSSLASTAAFSSSPSVESPFFDRVVILSNDKDFAQCLNPRVSLLSPKSGGGTSASSYVYTHADEVASVFGVPPHRFVDYLVLLGDAVDGIPGVDGIGDAKARKLMLEYENLEHVMQAIKSDAPFSVLKGKKLRASLLSAETHFPLWRQLATIRTDVGNLLPADLTLEPEQRWARLAYTGPGKHDAAAASAAVAAVAAAAPSPSLARVLDLYRRFNFPPPPNFLFPAPPADTASVTSTPASTTNASALRLMSQSEWSVESERRVLRVQTRKLQVQQTDANSTLTVLQTSTKVELSSNGAPTEKPRRTRRKRTSKSAPEAAASESAPAAVVSVPAA